jgi:hypothetical protein
VRARPGLPTDASERAQRAQRVRDRASKAAQRSNVRETVRASERNSTKCARPCE